MILFLNEENMDNKENDDDDVKKKLRRHENENGI